MTGEDFQQEFPRPSGPPSNPKSLSHTPAQHVHRKGPLNTCLHLFPTPTFEEEDSEGVLVYATHAYRFLPLTNPVNTNGQGLETDTKYLLLSPQNRATWTFGGVANIPTMKRRINTKGGGSDGHAKRGPKGSGAGHSMPGRPCAYGVSDSRWRIPRCLLGLRLVDHHPIWGATEGMR